MDFSRFRIVFNFQRYPDIVVDADTCYSVQCHTILFFPQVYITKIMIIATAEFDLKERPICCFIPDHPIDPPFYAEYLPVEVPGFLYRII